MTEIVFITKVFKQGRGLLGFYVPKRVIEFYELKVQYGGLNIDGTIEWRVGPPTESMNGELSSIQELPDMGTKLYRYNGGIRGVIPRWGTMPEAGTVVQLRVTIYEPEVIE